MGLLDKLLPRLHLLTSLQTSEDVAEALRLFNLPFAEAAEAAAALNARVASATYMHGKTPVVGDAVLWAGVRGASVMNGVLSKKKAELEALNRWVAALSDSVQAKAANEELKGAKTAKVRRVDAAAWQLRHTGCSMQR